MGRRRDPQPFPRLRHKVADDGGVDVAVGEEGGQGISHKVRASLRIAEILFEMP